MDKVATELHVRERDGRVERISVPDEGLTIGRKPPPFGASYCTANSSVSRLHCRLARFGDGWVIEDLGSVNGTGVNGELVEGSLPVRSGDTIVIGGREGLTAQLVEPPSRIERVRASYDAVADKYALDLADGMIARPIERGMLLAFSELVLALGDGVVGDLGCGPGHITKHLAHLGVRAIGVDISRAMIAHARSRFPAGDFRIASMIDLPIARGEWLGAVLLYATLHCNTEERARVLREAARVVCGDGYVLHGFYVSAPDQPAGSTYHLQRWFGLDVDLETYFVDVEDAAAEMDIAGFDVVSALVREPMLKTELPARRCYMLGRRRA